MPLRGGYPQQFVPAGLIDGFDSTKAFRGAFQLGANLCFDQANQGMLVARPGVTDAVDFSITPPFSALTPGIISVFKTIGTRVYGMIATSTTPNCDEPFAYETSSGTFIAISGVTGANVPTTQPAAGLWTPPTMAMIGVNLIITHPGYDGTGTNFFGVIDLTNPLAPAYSTQNLTTHALPGVPIAVANYFNRAWFALGNAAYYSDQLTLAATNANQILTLGDSSPLTALAGLPVSTNTQGVLAALIAFKGNGNSIWQITGDAGFTPSTLAQNEIAEQVGCSAPRSIQPTNEGLKFMGIDGIYVIDLIGRVRPLLFDDRTKSQDLQSPFIEATEAQASRAAAGYNLGVYRICLDTTLQGVAVTGADFWFDEHERRWNGPHSFPYDCTSPFGDAVIISSNTFPARLIFSDVQQHNNSVYTDLGVAYSCSLLYALLPDQEDMMMHAIVESMMELGRASTGSQYTIQAQDEFGNVLGTATITITSSGPIWGVVVWGSFVWTSGRAVSQMFTIPWTEPVVFQRIQMQIRTTASQGAAIGTMSLRYQRLGYMNVSQ